MNMSKSQVSRREFLKLSGYGLMGLTLPGFGFASDEFNNLQGRIISRTLWSYDAPDFSAARKKLYWHDLVVPLSNTTTGIDESAYNRIWYEAEEGGYLYSGSVQPVRTILNEPQLISLKGGLGEVTVPFTDARLEPDPDAEVLFRLYYESVHWVKASAVHPVDGKIWYALLDDKKTEQYYYVPAEHIRLIPDSDLTPLSPEIAQEDKRIQVRLNDQLVLAYEADKLVFATRTATGGRLRSGTYTTPTGDFLTFHKRPTRHMARGDIASSGFDLPGVPWVVYIKDNGISFHGTYWHNDYGRPRSHGCINLTPQAAKWLYRWTIPIVPPDKELAYGHVGTRVEIKE